MGFCLTAVGSKPLVILRAMRQKPRALGHRPPTMHNALQAVHSCSKSYLPPPMVAKPPGLSRSNMTSSSLTTTFTQVRKRYHTQALRPLSQVTPPLRRVNKILWLSTWTMEGSRLAPVMYPGKIKSSHCPTCASIPREPSTALYHRTLVHALIVSTVQEAYSPSGSWNTLLSLHLYNMEVECPGITSLQRQH